MNPITAMAYDIQQIKRRLDNMLQTGIVTAIHAEEGLVDVDIGGSIEEKIPFFTRRAGEDKTYWMPSINEKGLVLSPSGDLSNAMFLPSLNTFENPVPETDENLTVRVWEDGARESYDKDTHEYLFQIDENTLRKINQEEIQDKIGNSHIKQNGSETEIKRPEGTIKIDGGETKLERATGALKAILGSNQVELSAILLNLIGAHLFPSGVTNIVSPVGNCFFAPTPSPPSAPSPPADSNPNSNGEATQTPPSTVNNISVLANGSLNITVTIPPIVVTTPSGPGTTVATPLVLTLTLTGGRLNLRFPARSL